MSTPIDDIVGGFQSLSGTVPDALQPLVVALAGAVPFIEGEGSGAIGVLGGLHPVVAGIAGAIGNLVAVTIVVLLGARIREAAIAGRRRRAAAREGALVGAGGAPLADDAADDEPWEASSTRQMRVHGWLTRFGVPGASLLAPLALPTHFTAALFIAAGVPKGWVLLWQAVAIVLWTAAVVALTAGVLAVLTG